MNGGGGVVNSQLNDPDSNQVFSVMSVDSNPSEGSMEFEDAMEQQPPVHHNAQSGKILLFRCLVWYFNEESKTYPVYLAPMKTLRH